MKPPTQAFLPIKDVNNNLVFLKDGGISAVLETTAVNFDLLSENEQASIIQSFGALLNSLNFAIQIVVRSKRLDISNYLTRLDRAQQLQPNPLLKNMIFGYKKFVETLIKENDVLDKQFYIVLQVSSLELGIAVNPEKDIKKTLAAIEPRCNHLVKQLARCGIKAKRLDDERLVKLFYDIYNESETYKEEPITPQVQSPVIKTDSLPRNTQPIARPVQDMPIQPSKPLNQHTPFVVEELPDDYGTV